MNRNNKIPPLPVKSVLWTEGEQPWVWRSTGQQATPTPPPSPLYSLMRNYKEHFKLWALIMHSHVCNDWFHNLKIPGKKKKNLWGHKNPVKTKSRWRGPDPSQTTPALQASDKCCGDSSQCDLITHHLHHHQSAKGVTAEHFISASALCRREQCHITSTLMDSILLHPWFLWLSCDWLRAAS